MVLKNHRALESTQWFPHHCNIVIVSLGYKQCSVPMQNQSCLFITRRVTSCWILDSHCLLQITFYSFSTTTIIYHLWNCNQKYTRCIKQQHFLFSLNQNNSQNNDFFFFYVALPSVLCSHIWSKTKISRYDYDQECHKWHCYCHSNSGKSFC